MITLRKKFIRFAYQLSINILNDDVDVLPYLKERCDKKIALDSLYGTIAEHTREPVDAINKLGNRFSNKAIFASVLKEDDNPWLEAPAGSFAKGLHKTSELLRMNQAQFASEQLEKLSKRLEDTTQHERADYHYQLAKLNSLIGDFDSALSEYYQAYKICPNKKKYRLAYFETKLNKNYDNPHICQEILSEIDSDSGIEYVRLRAKALAFMKDKQAIDLLSDLEEKEVIVVKALVYLLIGEYDDCKRICDHALAGMDLERSSQLSIYLFRARSIFNMGFGSNQLKANDVIPFAGLPSMDDRVLRQCWNDIVYAWDIGKELGYPTDLVPFPINKFHFC